MRTVSTVSRRQPQAAAQGDLDVGLRAGVGGDVEAEVPVECQRGGHIGGDDADDVEPWVVIVDSSRAGC